ncbi:MULTISPECIES: hypothetical protein [Pseudomonas]|uniref:Lipoprotein n=1 Tax=Pseudomonas vlassakiae TaxID=485888 RepID=A0A923K8D4_9PSED|nr:MULTISPECIES: hypothetical protein [Pseudomonas]MBH3411721.1 hypothetical protein [Pseudomonas putida]MBV4539701.1 hypothetical protein [Pseudomonas vlassakiae]
MVSFKRVSMATLVLLLAGAGVQTVAAERSDSNTVKISFANNNDGNPGKDCTKELLWGTKGQFKLGDMECGNDNAYYFKVENMPAGAVLMLADSPSCDDDGNFYFKLRSAKHPFQMEWMKIQDLRTYAVGDQVKPGLKLLVKKGTGQIHGKLSCFRYEY